MAFNVWSTHSWESNSREADPRVDIDSNTFSLKYGSSALACPWTAQIQHDYYGYERMMVVDSTQSTTTDVGAIVETTNRSGVGKGKPSIQALFGDNILD